MYAGARDVLEPGLERGRDAEIDHGRGDDDESAASSSSIKASDRERIARCLSVCGPSEPLVAETKSSSMCGSGTCARSRTINLALRIIFAQIADHVRGDLARVGDAPAWAAADIKDVAHGVDSNMCELCVGQAVLPPAVPSLAKGTPRSGKARATRWPAGRAGNNRSRHQLEPLPGADGLDLSDHNVEPAGLAAADREQDADRAKAAIRKVPCISSHRISFLGQHRRRNKGDGHFAGLVVLTGNATSGTDR